MLRRIGRILRRLGSALEGAGDTGEDAFPRDLSPGDVEIIRRVRKRTITGVERLAALTEAVRYLVRTGVEGDFVECGVWRGGSMMAAALALLDLGATNRDLYLFDTFAGMPAPTDRDIDAWGAAASVRFKAMKSGEDRSDWCVANVDDVREGMASTGYPGKRVHLVPGKVEDTIPAEAPQHIALLRLDTDWYESTKHELVHLYPRVAPGGIVIIDDYGHWLGARQAVDEYVEEHALPVLLNRIDYTARLIVKPRIE